MKNQNKLILAILLMVPSFILKGQDHSFSQVADPTDIIARIGTANSDIHSISSDFQQEKELSFLEEKALSSGKFYFQKENKIRWEYIEPFGYIITMNGSLIQVEDEDRTSRLDASSNRMYSSIHAVLTGVIDGSVIQRTDQFRSSFSENPRMIRVTLEPVMDGMTAFIRIIELDLNKADYTVDALKIIEKNGDFTLIRFQNKKLNARIPEDIFSIH